MQNDSALTPRQRNILEHLIDFGGERPVFAPDLAGRLRERLESGLEPLVAARGPDERQWRLTKRVLTEVRTCEGLHVARREEPFEWSTAIARGSLAHRAIERLLIDVRARHPLEQARVTVERAGGGDDELAAFVSGLDDDDRADLVRDVSNASVEFLSQWPPIPPAWAPRVEVPVRAELCHGRVVLKGVYDLALGRPHGSEARVLIVDFKSGKIHPDHLDELRFYALVETLRAEVPPYRVAAYSLEGAGFKVEVVREEMLHGVVDWVVEGATALAELARRDREPRLSPSPLCTYCPATAAGTCEPGRDFLDGHVPPVRTGER